MNYYKIAPLSYIGRENSVLTYQSDEKFKPGMAVKIPIRNKVEIGIVTESAEKPEFITKKIIEAVHTKPILNSSLLNLAFWISEYYGASLVSVLQTMIPSGITKKRREKKTKENKIKNDEAKVLTHDQKVIFEKISKDLNTKPHLIFGVTGSGKTEIYLQLIDEVIKNGQQAIVLVPEIALTPQTFLRFAARFGDNVTILHSQLKETERFANWKAVLDGEKKVIIGSRSALFAPCDNLGLIIIDEEHETSYKQDKTPRYHAVKAAEKLAEFSKCGLVLGSATPSITTYYKAQNGIYELHTLKNRIAQELFPDTEIVDMRNEFKAGNKSIFSESLQAEMKKSLLAGQQTILFLNRRGTSTFVSCRDCGYVEKCPNCDIPLTFHLENNKLICHHCNLSKNPPVSCPSCGSWAIKYFGTGTQKVETEINKIFGSKYKIGRLDRDTAKNDQAHNDYYQKFLNKEIDILIGTQILAKGWDLPNVGLVGVISADTTLNFPDFTAAEKTFDLITQVAGRTGRGNHRGKVIIQTYNPDHYAIVAASKHDYDLFYKQELENRRELSYPPFANLIKIVYNNIVQLKGKEVSESQYSLIDDILNSGNFKYSLSGPSPAYLHKRAGSYYWQILAKLINFKDNEIINTVKEIDKISDKNWSIDVDPADLI